MEISKIEKEEMKFRNKGGSNIIRGFMFIKCFFVLYLNVFL